MNARLCAGDVCDVARVVDARDCDDVCGGGAVVDDSGNDDEGDEELIINLKAQRLKPKRL